MDRPGHEHCEAVIGSLEKELDAEREAREKAEVELAEAKSCVGLPAPADLNTYNLGNSLADRIRYLVHEMNRQGHSAAQRLIKAEAERDGFKADGLALMAQLAEAKKLLADAPDESDLDAAVFEVNQPRVAFAKCAIELVETRAERDRLRKHLVAMLRLYDENDLYNDAVADTARAALQRGGSRE